MIDAILATFTSPEHVETTVPGLLWLFPLLISISIVYKATKVYKIKGPAFARESLVLFGSICAFIIVAAFLLIAFAWFMDQQLPHWLTSETNL